jgi:hypothetical protein
MNNKVLTKINKFLAKELFQNMNDIIIFQNDDGSYEFFNKYNVIKEVCGYQVYSKYNSETHRFSSLKSAAAWCIFENRNKYVQAKRIEYLDQMISGSEVSIEMQRNLLKKAKETESKLIYAAKLNEEQHKRKRMITEMQSYIRESSRLQTQKFSHK